jgi:hypothetical protein
MLRQRVEQMSQPLQLLGGLRHKTNFIGSTG